MDGPSVAGAAATQLDFPRGAVPASPPPDFLKMWGEKTLGQPEIYPRMREGVYARTEDAFTPRPHSRSKKVGGGFVFFVERPPSPPYTPPVPTFWRPPLKREAVRERRARDEGPKVEHRLPTPPPVAAYIPPASAAQEAELVYQRKAYQPVSPVQSTTVVRAKSPPVEIRQPSTPPAVHRTEVEAASTEGTKMHGELELEVEVEVEVEEMVDGVLTRVRKVKKQTRPKMVSRAQGLLVSSFVPYE